MTRTDAIKKAAETGGHVVCLHRIDGYEYDVTPGKDPRAWIHPSQKEKTR